MIRVLHIINTLRVGGAETMLLKLLSARPADWSPAVVSLEEGGALAPRLAELGVPVSSLRIRGDRPNPARIFSLLPLSRRFRPHLVQGWLPQGNLLASLAAAALPGNVPVLWNVRMSLDNLDAERWLTATSIRLGALFSRQPVTIIYNSRTAAAQHEAIGYCARRRAVLPNGFDCQRFRPDEEVRRQVRAKLSLPEDAILIGLLARYHPMKDHAGFLQAAARVARAHPKAYFLLAGTGVTADQPTLAGLLRDLHLQDRTFLLGERSDVPRLTSSLDIACSASAWGEGFSNAVGEAMACGVPSIVTDVGDSAYVVGETGLVVPPRSPAALAEAIGRLAGAAPQRRRELGAEARRRIERDFSLPSIVRRYEDLYHARLREAQGPA